MAESPDERPGLAGRMVDRLVGGVVGPAVEHVDFDHVVEQIDINDVLDRVDVDALLERVDIDALLDRVDVDRLVERVDANALLDRVDPNALLDRVDPNALLGRVDPNALLDRVDVNALVDRTELPTIIARSTTGVFSQILDGVRTRLMVVDQVTQGAIGRLLGRPTRAVPGGPAEGVEPVDRSGRERMGDTERAVALQQRYAGSVSRFLGFLVDQFAIGILFSLTTALFVAALRVVVGFEPDLDESRPFLVAAYLGWAYVYVAGSLAVSGRTVGKAVVGLRVTTARGQPLSGGSAALRTIAFPLSFLSFGIGFLLGLVRRDRRELHDLIASTAVIYDWDAVTTQLRREAAERTATPEP